MACLVICNMYVPNVTNKQTIVQLGVNKYVNHQKPILLIETIPGRNVKVCLLEWNLLNRVTPLKLIQQIKEAINIE